jgi:hypothetical protein
MEPWAVAKSFKLVWQFHHLLSRFLAISYMSQVLCQSCLFANDKGDNEMIWGAVHRSHDIYFAAEENLS